MSKDFVHLHVHSEYSLLDGACKIGDLCSALERKGMHAIAITDHGNMCGLYKAQKAFQAYNKKREKEYQSDPSKGKKPEQFKAIFGCEFYVAHDMNSRNYDLEKTHGRDHLILLAKNQKGYKNLVKLDSLAYTKGMYYKPRIDMQLLEKHSEGLICLSACLAGRVPKLLLQNDYEGAKEYALKLKSLFDEGDFYIELQDHGIAAQRMVNPLLIKLARDIGVKVVATNDVHYIDKEDALAHDILLCIQTDSKVDDTNRMRFETQEFYLKTYDEMYEKFGYIQEALDSTVEIANKCNVRIEHQNLFPAYVPPTGETPIQYLRRMAFEGLERRYGTVTKEIKERAEMELGVIETTGFPEYFLIVWDFIDYARKHNIPVGPGRGSGVGSIIAYAIGITGVDPLRYNLIFDRFLNPERLSNPDFDIDFCVIGREKVIDYVVQKYGSEKVCQIITFGTLAARNVFKNVAKVYGIGFSESNSIAKFIPQKGALPQALGLVKLKDDEKDLYSPDLVELYGRDPRIKEILDVSMKLEGLPKNTSKHAAGVVICREVISDFVPLHVRGDDVTTQYTKEEVEELGMLKMDFLGLNTLTDIDLTKKYIKENHGIDIDFDKIGYDDPAVFNLISSGDTDGVFQLESSGMKSFMMDFQPSTLEDIIAGISLYRPGPIDSIGSYIQAKRNPETITYADPVLEPILSMTYGHIVYQEQVMQIFKEIGGYSFGGADRVRRIMAKKDEAKMAKEKVSFLNGYEETPAEYDAEGKILTPYQAGAEGALKRGFSEEMVLNLFEDIGKFARYAFNKSHATAYAYVAYQTAYLKAHYFLEFLTATMNNRILKPDEVEKYLLYLKRKNVKIKLPDINKSDVYFKVEGDGIRFGMLALKDVGFKNAQAIEEERKANGDYKSFEDLVNRLDKQYVQKKTLMALVNVGAFDKLNQTRATLINGGEEYMHNAVERKKNEVKGQGTIFDFLSTPIELLTNTIPVVEEFDDEVLYQKEKEVAGIYLTGHPLKTYANLIKDNQLFTLLDIIDLIIDDSGRNEQEEEFEQEDVDDSLNPLTQLREKYNKKRVTMVAVLDSFNIKMSKRGSQFTTMRLSDENGEIDGIMLSKATANYKDCLVASHVYYIQGQLELEEGKEPQIEVKKISPINLDSISGKTKIKEIGDDSNLRLCLDFRDADEIKQRRVRDKLKMFKGDSECIIQYYNQEGKVALGQLAEGVSITYPLKCFLFSELGEGKYKIVNKN